MSAKKPPVLLATDNNSLKNKILEKLLKLETQASCVSASEFILNPDQYLFEQPTILILDIGKITKLTKMKDIEVLGGHEHLKVILLTDTKTSDTLEKMGAPPLETPFTTISADPSLREIALAINYCSAIIHAQTAERELKRERWAQKALTGLYQRTEEPGAILAGIMGITATALNLKCAVVTLEGEHSIRSVICHSGSKSDLLELSWKRLPRSKIMLEIASRFIQLKEIAPGPCPLNLTNKNIFAPTTGLLTCITRPGSDPAVFCALGSPERTYLDYEKRIFIQSALFACMTLELASKTDASILKARPQERSTHQHEL